MLYNNIIILLLPFIIELIIFIIIMLLVFIYLFNINKYISNDKFLIEFLLLFLTLFSVILIYICFTDIEVFFYSDKLFVIETNNLLIKIFMLIHLIYYVFYDH